MYWLCSFPIGEEAPDRVWGQLQQLTANNGYSVNHKFKLPDNLKVGTLDSLMALSDDLIKVNAAVEGTVNKIRRQLYELQAALPEDERSDVWVEGMTPEGYLQRFAWNEAKYPSRRPPKDTVQSIMETTQKLDDDLKARAASCGELLLPDPHSPDLAWPPTPAAAPPRRRRCAPPSTPARGPPCRPSSAARPAAWRCATSPPTSPAARWCPPTT